MFIKRLNHFCGYAFYIVGVLRVLVVILAIISAGSAMVSIFSGNNNVDVSYGGLTIFGSAIAIAQILLTMISIPMIFINKKEEPEISTGYLYGGGAYLLEFIIPGFLMIYFVFVEAFLYMKAGNKIIKITSTYSKIQRREANTEWFYNQTNRNNNNEEDNENIINEIKKEKRNEKLLEEIYEWRKLLDSGEIDEDSYNEMKDKLLKKMQK